MRSVKLTRTGLNHSGRVYLQGAVVAIEALGEELAQRLVASGGAEWGEVGETASPDDDTPADDAPNGPDESGVDDAAEDAPDTEDEPVNDVADEQPPSPSASTVMTMERKARGGKCAGVTKSGKPCSGPAMPNGFCRMHGGDDEGGS